MKDVFNKEGSILERDYMICMYIYMYVCVCMRTHTYIISNTYLQKKKDVSRKKLWKDLHK